MACSPKTPDTQNVKLSEHLYIFFNCAAPLELICLVMSREVSSEQKSYRLQK